MIRAVLFDIDDTIVDFRGGMRGGLRACLDEIAPWFTAADRAAAVETWSALEARHFGRYLSGELTFAEQRRVRAREFCARHELRIGPSVDEQDRWVAAYLRHCDAAFRLFPDVLDTLDRLAARGLRIGAVSNSTGVYQDRKLRLLGVRDRFAALVCCDDVGGAAKPDPRIFLAGCAAVAGAPDECLYVGDNLDTDARAARAAGLEAVWLDRTGSGGAPPPPVPRIASLHQLADLVTGSPAADPTRKEPSP
jgi:putative hydrolase of the HAD superfamily